MLSTMRISKRTQKLIAEQGWDDESILALALNFIFGQDLSDRFESVLEEAAAEENRYAMVLDDFDLDEDEDEFEDEDDDLDDEDDEFGDEDDDEFDDEDDEFDDEDDDDF